MKYALWTIVTTYLLWIHFVAIMHLKHMLKSTMKHTEHLSVTSAPATWGWRLRWGK